MLYEIFYLAGFSLVTTLHLVGFILLYKAKGHHQNQRLLILNLAAIEMFCGCFGIMQFSVILCRASTPEWNYALGVVLMFISMRVRLAVLHVIFDRFLEIYTNIRYPLYMTAKKLIWLTVLMWIISAHFAMIRGLLMSFKGYKVALIFTLVSLLTFDFIVISSAIVTYVYFYFIVKGIKRKENSRNALFRQRSAMTNFKQPCYIVLTYIFFNFTSMVLGTISGYVRKDERPILLAHISTIFIILGFIADAVIYVFANRDVRHLLYSTFCKKIEQNTFQAQRDCRQTKLISSV